MHFVMVTIEVCVSIRWDVSWDELTGTKCSCVWCKLLSMQNQKWARERHLLKGIVQSNSVYLIHVHSTAHCWCKAWGHLLISGNILEFQNGKTIQPVIVCCSYEPQLKPTKKTKWKANLNIFKKKKEANSKHVGGYTVLGCIQNDHQCFNLM